MLHTKEAKIILAAICTSAFFVIGITVPIRIEASPSAPIYETSKPNHDNFNVCTTTIFGITKDVDNYEITAAKNETAAVVQTGLLSREVPIDFVKVSKIQAEYTDTLYQYETPNKEKIAVSYLYEDGNTEECTSFKVDNVISAEHLESIQITTDYGDTTLTITPIMVDHISATIGSVYEGQSVNADSLCVTAIYEDGHEKDITDVCSCTISSESIIDTTSVPVHTGYGDTTLVIDPVRIDHLETSYDGSTKEDEPIDADKVHASYVYADGTSQTLASNDFEISGQYAGDGITIKAPLAEGSLAPETIAITNISADIPEKLYEHDVISPSELTITYEGGTTKTVPVSDTPHEITIGEQDIGYEVNGYKYKLHITGLQNTNVSNAKRNYANEIEKADYSHVSDTLFATITHYDAGEASYFLTHVVINDPAQLVSGLSHDTYGGEREAPSSAAKRNEWTVCVNGSNFSYATGKPDTSMANVVIKNGGLIEGHYANGMEICVKEDGTLFSPDKGTSAESLLAMGVRDTYLCGDTLLINDGQAVNEGIQSNQYRYPRTAVGMVKSCEYYIITAGSGVYKGGMTYDEVRDALMDKGCVYGKCMDGGGSANLAFEGNLISHPAENNTERPVADFLAFRD